MALIRRNPGTSWFIFCVVFSFILGIALAWFGWNELVWRCWVLIAVWYMTHYQARWAGRLMKRELAKRDQDAQK